MSAVPAPCRPDFQSLVPFDGSERGEFLAGLDGLWHAWAPDDARWLVMQMLAWAISDQSTQLDARLGRALRATVEAVQDMQRRDAEWDEVTDGMLDAVKLAAGTLCGIADEVRLAREHELGTVDPSLAERVR